MRFLFIYHFLFVFLSIYFVYLFLDLSVTIFLFLFFFASYSSLTHFYFWKQHASALYSSPSEALFFLLLTFRQLLSVNHIVMHLLDECHPLSHFFSFLERSVGYLFSEFKHWGAALWLLSAEALFFCMSCTKTFFFCFHSLRYRYFHRDTYILETEIPYLFLYLTSGGS